MCRLIFSSQSPPWGMQTEGLFNLSKHVSCSSQHRFVLQQTDTRGHFVTLPVPTYSKLDQLCIYLRCSCLFLMWSTRKSFKSSSQGTPFDVKWETKVKRFLKPAEDVTQGYSSWKIEDKNRSQKGTCSCRMGLILPVRKQKNWRGKYLILLRKMKLKLKLNITAI